MAYGVLMILALPVWPGMPSANIYAQFWCVFGDAKCQQQQQQQQQLVYCSVCVWEGGWHCLVNGQIVHLVCSAA
jgi:hypothetical protein